MSGVTVGAVQLNVSNLDQLITFYQEHIGLQVHQRTSQTGHLGVGEDDLLILTETPQRTANHRVTGLFHFALLLPERAQLARTLKHFAEARTPLQGMSDHIVSEAIYLADPDGNGIEIYRDRPRDIWYKDGQFQLTTIPLNLDDLMASLDDNTSDWQGLPQGTVMGHVHLRVASIPQTEAFYREVLGMEVMSNIGSATFMSYDGYHHHLGGNIWGGQKRRTGDELGLAQYTLHINDERLQAILAAADANGITVTEDSGHYTLYDPSNNQIMLQLA